MKRNYVFLVLFLLIGAPFVKAQGILDKIDRAVNTADRAADKADRAGKVGKKVGGLLGKKKNTSGEEVEESKAQASNTTTINITGISYEKLDILNDRIKACAGVTASAMKYNKKGSTITVSHTTSSDDLLAEMIKKSDGIVTKSSVEGVEEGAIELAVK